MTVEDYATQLARVQAAIAALETGGNQEYSIGGRTFRKVDLKTLYDREKWLRGQVGRNNGQGGARFRYGATR